MLMWVLCKISITPTLRQNIFLLRKISIFRIPKSTVLIIIFKVFMWPISSINIGPRSIIHLQSFEMVSKKDEIICYRQDGRCNSLSYSDSVMTSKKKKNRRAMFKIQMKNIVYLLNQRMIHCLILSQKCLPLYLIH